mmetsp:Transcript_1174/g.3987  ORF Transcript_1174/g.3987 Transcript_1174/m.3987 type:complete len:527 (-) Transcript_1174:457-2037(-)
MRYELRRRFRTTAPLSVLREYLLPDVLVEERHAAAGVEHQGAPAGVQPVLPPHIAVPVDVGESERERPARQLSRGRLDLEVHEFSLEVHLGRRDPEGGLHDPQFDRSHQRQLLGARRRLHDGTFGSRRRHSVHDRRKGRLYWRRPRRDGPRRRSPRRRLLVGALRRREFRDHLRRVRRRRGYRHGHRHRQGNHGKVRQRRRLERRPRRRSVFGSGTLRSHRRRRSPRSRHGTRRQGRGLYVLLPVARRLRRRHRRSRLRQDPRRRQREVLRLRRQALTHLRRHHTQAKGRRSFVRRPRTVLRPGLPRQNRTGLRTATAAPLLFHAKQRPAPGCPCSSLRGWWSPDGRRPLRHKPDDDHEAAANTTETTAAAATTTQAAAPRLALRPVRRRPPPGGKTARRHSLGGKGPRRPRRQGRTRDRTGLPQAHRRRRRPLAGQGKRPLRQSKKRHQITLRRRGIRRTLKKQQTKVFCPWIHSLPPSPRGRARQTNKQKNNNTPNDRTNDANTNERTDEPRGQRLLATLDRST